jgi:hypothetical protein
MFTPTFEPFSAAGVPGVGPGRTPVQTWTDLADVVCAYAYAGEGWWAMELPQLATFKLDLSARSTIRVFARPGASRDLIEDLYRRSVVPLFMQALGRETLHASAVNGERGVLAFCGDRGTGKSTIAYGLARRGFAQHADDTLVLNLDAGAVKTVPLQFAPRLRPAARTFFGYGAGISDFPDGQETRAEPLATVFILRRDDACGDPRVRRLPPPAAFDALLRHAHCFEPGNPVQRRRLLQNYLDISTKVPVFGVSFAPGLEGLERLLDKLLQAAVTPGLAAIERLTQ